MFYGLRNLAEALQGGPEEEEDDKEVQEPQEEGVRREGPEGQGTKDDSADGDGSQASEDDDGTQLSFWGVASVLTATVKAKTTQVLTAVQETDWRAELEAFQQGAKEDAEAVGKGADIVMHKAKEAAEQLPTALEHLPGSAATLQARAEAAGTVARVQAGRSLAGLAGLGSKLVLGTHDLLEQISHAVQNEMALIDDSGSAARLPSSSKALTGQAKYSRFEADVAAMQRDSTTYCDEPEDVEDFEAWLAGFDLVARKPDVDSLIAENTFMSELQARIVPLIVEYDAFWTRYFYRLHKLEQKHQQFLQLAQRAQQPEEEVGWSSEEEAEPRQPARTSAVGGGGLAGAPSATQSAPLQDEAEKEDEVEEQAAAEAAPTASVAPVHIVGADGDVEQHEELIDSAGSFGSKGQDQQGAAHWRAASGSDDSAAATLSSDSDHWQVVSPRQRSSAVAAATGSGQPEASSGAAPAGGPNAAAAAAAMASQAVSKPGGAADVAKPAAGQAGGTASPASAAAAQQAALKAAENDDELSDWGDDDEAVLATAAAENDGEEEWGSPDWE